MLKMEMWQWIVVGLVAALCFGGMIYSLLRLFPADSQNAGTVRVATPLETGLYSGRASSDQHVFDAWSYRVQARLAGRVRIVVDDDNLTVAGPRVPFGLYAFWMWLHGLILAAAPVVLVWGLVRLDWRGMVAGVLVALLSFAISAVGAGLWPGFGELVLAGEGHFNAVEVPLSSVEDVELRNWARDGMEIVLLPYKKPIDGLAGNAVTFRAPDGEGHFVTYALQMFTPQDAQEFSALLKGGSR